MRRTTAVLLLFLTPLTACRSWTTPDSFEPARAGVPDTLFRVRLLHADGSASVLYRAVVRADSVVGFGHEPHPWKRVPDVAVARDEIREIQVRRVSAGKTLLAVAAIPVVIVGLTLLACTVSGGCFGDGDFLTEYSF